MHRKHIDLLIAVTITAVACALTLTGTSTILRVVVGLPLTLFLPGYALIAMMPSYRQALVERILLSFGLSIGIMIASGLVLNVTPWGLSVDAWTILLSTITLIGCSVAFLQRQVASTGPVMLDALPRFRELLGFGVAICILAGAVGVARVGAMQQTQPGYTQVWMLPDTQGVANNIRLGMLNVEHATTTYEVRLVSKGTTLHTWSALTLAPGERWETVVVLQDALPASDKLEAMVYRSGEPAVYRHVSYWPPQEQP